MTSEIFARSLGALLSREPFKPFTIELRVRRSLDVRDPKALRRPGATIFTDRKGTDHYFDHESVVQISEFVPKKKGRSS